MFKHVTLNTANIYIMYPQAPVMCERMKRRTVCNESGNSGQQRERDVNYSCKTWTNLPAELFHLRLNHIVDNIEEILPAHAYIINDEFLCR